MNRLPMPITAAEQNFSCVAEIKDALASLVARTSWWLSTRSAVEIREEYEGLAAWCWVSKADEGFVAHLALADHAHAEVHYPANAMIMPIRGASTLANAETHLRSEMFVATLLVLGTDYFLKDFTTGSIH